MTSISKVVQVERVEDDLYISNGLKMAENARSIYGGLIVAQALMSALSSSVQDNCRLHSFHSYFVRPVRESVELKFKLIHVRDGQTFCLRKVVAEQADEVVFIAECSFANTFTSSSSISWQMPAIDRSVKYVEYKYNQADWISETTEGILERSKRLIARPFIAYDIVIERIKEDLSLDFVDWNTDLVYRFCVPDLESSRNLHQSVVGYVSDHLLLASALTLSSEPLGADSVCL